MGRAAARGMAGRAESTRDRKLVDSERLEVAGSDGGWDGVELSECVSNCVERPGDVSLVVGGELH
jgi:hypothetical protein